jgi:hypothetical protein
VDFELIGEITDIERIAAGRVFVSCRDCGGCLEKAAQIRLAELHWYEAHGIGKKEFKRKRSLD